MGVADLVSVVGSDERLSARIVSYGRKLGGYTSMDQLYEVYGADSSLVTMLQEHFFIELDFLPMKVNINRMAFEFIREHPYISDELAKAIVRYRELNGPIKDFNELIHFRSVDQRQIKKLFPYLEF